MKRNIISIVTLIAILTVVLCGAAFAENESYSFNKGKQENEARQSVYAQLPDHTESVDKSGYVDFDANGSEGAIDTLNADALVEAGVIDQATADAIKAYATAKHENISGIYDGMDSMTPQERSEAFASRKSADGGMGDTVQQLLDAEVITQAQADAINEYLAK